MNEDTWDEHEGDRWRAAARPNDEPSFARCLPVAILTLLGTTFAAYHGFRLLQGDSLPSLSLPETSPLLLLGLEPEAANVVATRFLLASCAVLAVAFLGLLIARRIALRVAGFAGVVIAACAGLAWILLTTCGGLGSEDPSIAGEIVRGHLGPPYGVAASAAPFAIGLAYGLALLLAAVFSGQRSFLPEAS